MSSLFTEYKLKSVTLRNRIAVAPMCQYSATDGVANDWHFAHYTSMARGGAGLVIVEATAVSPDGRITPACLGLWNDQQTDKLAKIAAEIKKAGAIPGIQIAHAGRKASANKPWEGDNHIAENDPRAWQTIAPSDIAFGVNLPRVPKAMTLDDIQRVQNDFVNAAKRARDAGFEWLELHFAHGYLGQSFFSTHSNQRHDQYGGSLENRSRFLIETVAKTHEVWPEHLPLTARLGVIEYDGNDETTLNDSIQLTRWLKEAGLDFLNVSIGFSTPEANVPWGPAFLAPIAERIRYEVNIPVAASWGINAPDDAERVIANKQMDIVMIGKAFLADPHYPYYLASKLNIERPSWILPEPYAHWLEQYKMY